MTAGPSPGAAFDVDAWLSVLGIEQYETERVTLPAAKAPASI
jgi:hypothetical protein